MRMFREMEEAGIQADVQAYNSVISSCARGGRWEHAWEVCSSMRRIGCQPNTRTYNALISACERAREPQRALEAYRKMQREAGTPLPRLSLCNASAVQPLMCMCLEASHLIANVSSCWKDKFFQLL